MPAPRAQKFPKPKTDVDYWNFGLLSPVSKLDASGQIRIIPMKAGESADAAGVLNSGAVVFLLRKQRLIRTWNLQTRESTILWRAEGDEDPLDIAVRDDSVYVLERATRTIRHVSPSHPGVKRYQLECDALDEFARLEIADIEERGVLCAIAGPTESGRFRVLSLGSDPKNLAAAIESGLSRSSELGSLGSRFSMCADSRRSTLLIADTQRHRILELDYFGSKEKIICGSGVPGPPSDGDSPAKLTLNAPRSIALYPQDSISAALLDPKSRQFAKADSTRAFPRTLIIADTGNHTVRRLIEMGDDPALLSLRGIRRLHMLVGNGTPPAGPVTIPDSAAEADMSRYPVREPSHVSVSARGHLTIVVGMGRAIVWLQPASVAAEKKFSPIVKEYYAPS